ncbi:MAG: sugar ABC transporter permease [Natronomonas sp.]|uniref:carbohydrate ABC transporter permease n=1 Tax=Natronomonas sp. TaxID=2184060 RepID=UPI0028706923|nr:sugar ABC transporter permease [Natronomonas sp.]MDR9431888.1 sugar ABC transporter permease [Natronomonas sp.]
MERLSEDQFAYLLLAPIFLLVGTLGIYPLVRVLDMSLHADSLASSNLIGDFVGLTNYVELFTGQRTAILTRPFANLSQPFKSALPVTFIFTIAAGTLSTLFGFAAALLLNESFKGRSLARVAILLPWATPIVIQGMAFFLMFQNGIGFAIEPLNDLGLVSANPLASSQDTLMVAILADTWKFFPFMALLILAGLQSIDPTYYRVARVAGASRWQRFKTITLPLVMPALMIALLFRLLRGLKVYGLFESLTQSGCSTLTSLTCLLVLEFNGARYGTASAIGFSTALVIAVTILTYLLVVRRFLPEGAQRF